MRNQYPADIKEAYGQLNLIKNHISDHIKNAPRSLQTTIGPSELGNPCDHCLAARLAGWTKNEHETPWLPFIGTCVHEHFERLFSDQTGTVPLGPVEQKITVGLLGGREIRGSCDLFIPQVAGMGGMSVDWKIVGASKLQRVRASGHPGKQYEVQAHLYGRGWNKIGRRCTYVSVYFLPRNNPSLDNGYMWCDWYNEQIALDALARAERIEANIRVLETISTEKRDQWISTLNRAPDCWDCKKYPDYNTDPFLEGIELKTI